MPRPSLAFQQEPRALFASKAVNVVYVRSPPLFLPTRCGPYLAMPIRHFRTLASTSRHLNQIQVPANRLLSETEWRNLVRLKGAKGAHFTWSARRSRASSAPWACDGIADPLPLCLMTCPDMRLRMQGVQQSRGWVHYMQHQPGAPACFANALPPVSPFFRARPLPLIPCAAPACLPHRAAHLAIQAQARPSRRGRAVKPH